MTPVEGAHAGMVPRPVTFRDGLLGLLDCSKGGRGSGRQSGEPLREHREGEAERLLLAAIDSQGLPADLHGHAALKKSDPAQSHARHPPAESDDRESVLDRRKARHGASEHGEPGREAEGSTCRDGECVGEADRSQDSRGFS